MDSLYFLKHLREPKFDYGHLERISEEEYMLSVPFSTNIQFLSAQKEMLSDGSELDVSKGMLPLHEKLSISKDNWSILVSYGFVSPNEISYRRFSLPNSFEGQSDEFVEHETQKILDRYHEAIKNNAPLKELKVSDILSYRSDIIKSVGVYLLDEHGRVLLQQRAKDIGFGLYHQPSANGKLETWTQALSRELGEELGSEVSSFVGNSVTCVSETPYILTKKGVSKDALSRDYVARVNSSIESLIAPNKDEMEKVTWVSKADLDNGHIVSKSYAKEHGLDPNEYIILFDDQFVSLKHVLESFA